MSHSTAHGSRSCPTSPVATHRRPPPTDQAHASSLPQHSMEDYFSATNDAISIGDESSQLADSTVLTVRTNPFNAEASEPSVVGNNTQLKSPAGAGANEISLRENYYDKPLINFAENNNEQVTQNEQEFLQQSEPGDSNSQTVPTGNLDLDEDHFTQGQGQGEGDQSTVEDQDNLRNRSSTGEQSNNGDSSAIEDKNIPSQKGSILTVDDIYLSFWKISVSFVFTSLFFSDHNYSSSLLARSFMHF